MKRLIRKAHVPIPPFNIHLGPGPSYRELTYYDQNKNVVFWQGPLSSHADVYDFYHECGHAFDRTYLTDQDREHIKPLLGASITAPWFWNRPPQVPASLPDPVCEQFADAFAELCMSPRRRPQLKKLVLQAAHRKAA